MGKCTIKSDWFSKKDALGYKISSWAKKHSDKEIFCIVCMKVINIGLKGYQAIEQHASTKKHNSEVKIKLGPLQMHLCSSQTLSSLNEQGKSSSSNLNVTTSTSESIISIANKRDCAIKAELIWVLKLICSNYSYSSCDGIVDVFKSMFNEAVPETFSLSRTKAHYLVTDALEPYFRKCILKDLEDVYYSICYDETTNNGGNKELQITVRYWSKLQSRIVSRHVSTFFIGVATAEILHGKLLKAMDAYNLPLKNILMLGADGPNINKKVQRLMNEDVIEVRRKGLINMGSCNIHIVHNSFLKGLQEHGKEVSQLIFDVHHFFDGWPARWEKFNNIQMQFSVPQHHFIKHCSSRWLTIVNSAARILEQWDPIVHYFIKEIPKQCKELIKNATYSRITNKLKDPYCKAEVFFILSSAKVFTHFTGHFQKDEPLIHELYTEMSNVIIKICNRVLKPSIKKSDINEDSFIEKNLLPLKDIVYGDGVEEALCFTDICDVRRLNFMKKCQQHYIISCKHMINKFTSYSNILKPLRFLQPNNITSQRSYDDLLSVANMLPVKIKFDELSDEWKMLIQDVKPCENNRIDEYWENILKLCHPNGSRKYSNVDIVIKASLALSHGNADIERRFSCSGNILTEVRASMNERTLNATLMVKDALKMYHNKPSYVPITKELISFAQNAHKHYQNYMDEQKRISDEAHQKLEQEEEKKKLEEENMTKLKNSKDILTEQEAELKKIRNEESRKRKAGDELFLEANSRLKVALHEKNMVAMEVAQNMMEAYKTAREHEKKVKEDGDALQANVNKRKSLLITSFFAKKPKL